MSSQRLLGVLLLVGGVVLLVIGINASDSIADQWSEFFTGTFTNSTVWLMLGGVAAMVGGLAVMLSGRRPAIV